MRKKDNFLLGFEIETAKPEDSREALAIKLADALQVEINARQDAMEYQGQAQRERKKAKTMINILTSLQEYNKKKKKLIANDPEWETRPPYEGGPSRMDPMASYNEKDLKKQKIESIKRAKEFDELARHYNDIAKEARKIQEDLQRKIRTGNGGIESRFIPIKE